MRTLTAITLALWLACLGILLYLIVVVPSLDEPAVVEVHVPQPTPAALIEPYGGCDEAWQAPKSEGAQWCRDHAELYDTDSPFHDSYVYELMRGEHG